MPGPLRRLEAGQQDELVGTAAARGAGGVSAVCRSRGESASARAPPTFHRCVQVVPRRTGNYNNDNNNNTIKLNKPVKHFEARVIEHKTLNMKSTP